MLSATVDDSMSFCHSGDCLSHIPFEHFLYLALTVWNLVETKCPSLTQGREVRHDKDLVIFTIM